MASDLTPTEAAARVIALRSMLPLGPGARDIAAHIVVAVDPLIREQIAADIEAEFAHLGPFHPYAEFVPLVVARIARGTA